MACCPAQPVLRWPLARSPALIVSAGAGPAFGQQRQHRQLRHRQLRHHQLRHHQLRHHRVVPGAAPKTMGRAPAEPRPSASVMVLSAANEVLLLHRVSSSTSFASAHVFPGGNLDAFHDGPVPEPGTAGRHRDGPAYRLAAVRECFEETGILLARRGGAELLAGVSAEQRDEARRRIHANEVRFGDWLASLGGEPDTENLMPFTRWITPAGVPRRFTTQMYVYMLPLARAGMASETVVPTPDGGVEHTAAQFAAAAAVLERARAGAVTLFPPQHYLLHLLAEALDGAPGAGAAFLRRTPTAATAAGRGHATAGIAWADKAVCPRLLPARRADGRAVLALDAPGPELAGSGRGGDWERVVLVDFAEGGPRDVEVRWRADVLGGGGDESRL